MIKEMIILNILCMKYITKIVYHHLINIIYSNEIDIVNNYVKDKNKFYIGQDILASYSKENIENKEYEFIEKLSLSDHLFYNFSVLEK